MHVGDNTGMLSLKERRLSHMYVPVYVCLYVYQGCTHAYIYKDLQALRALIHIYNFIFLTVQKALYIGTDVRVPVKIHIRKQKDA
jgi:hypothetical protein